MYERRRHPRAPFEGHAYLTFDGRCRCEPVLDVSPAGLSLQSDARLRVGKAVKVFLPLPEADGQFRLSLLKGRVVRRARGVEGRNLGIAFEPGVADTRGLLGAYLAG